MVLTQLCIFQIRKKSWHCSQSLSRNDLYLSFISCFKVFLDERSRIEERKWEERKWEKKCYPLLA